MGKKIGDVTGQEEEGILPVINRRQFVQGGAAAIAFAALGNRTAKAAEVFTRDYGPLSPKVDETTGLKLIQLPDGFRYRTFGWTGQRMNDGHPTPVDHDGMAVVAARGNQVVLVRNHEISGNIEPHELFAPSVYDPTVGGGTTNLLFDTLKGDWERSWGSLAGTAKNCAGGPTPWGTWLTCEETMQVDGEPHGFVFEVSGFGMDHSGPIKPLGRLSQEAADAVANSDTEALRSFGLGNPKPIKPMGRFSHEAAAVDPATGYVYLTEDDRPSAFYRFRPNGKWGDLHSGGTLEALAIKDQPNFVFGTDDNFPSFENGSTWSVEWVPVNDPEAKNGRAFDSAPGRAIFTRGEGCWEDSGKIYFDSTDGGSIRQGQVFEYDPRRQRLTLIFESPNKAILSNPDNITVGPRGGILLCEDGSFSPERLIGLNHDGNIFEFGRNNIQLTASDIDRVNSELPGVKGAVSPGDYRTREWCGATFHNRWLFVNIQDPGITFAITGPWEKGSL